ncbi:hypothetical protein Cgig2_016430 [Carnegiea gigantea]|uniref:Uncharacterized protein n=1 Tax=Carnegiea gigantea TaxID=171969 RepID=A0A9Q1K359_9CARY|nr:hypothetical protein Cgig2_016430 [Carnegiea gigantea]
MNEYRPDCVPKDQWISLVTYWISNKVKNVNRVEPSRAYVYVDTHKDRKTRPAPMDEKSKQAVVNMINEKLSQLQGGKEVTNGNVAWEAQRGEHLMMIYNQCSERMEFLEAKNKRLQDKLTSLKGQQNEVLAKIARLRAVGDNSMTDDATPSNSIRTQNVA